MKKSNDILFQLLKLLEGDSMQQFTYFIKATHKGKEEEQIQNLTSLILNNPEIEEGILKKKIGKSFAEVKSKTYYCLLDFFRVTKNEKPFLNAHRMLDFAILMQDIGNWKEAVRFYEVVNNWALKNQNLHYEMISNAHQSWSINRQLSKTNLDLPKQYAIINKELSEKLLTASNIHLLYLSISEIIFESYLIRSKETHKKVEDLLIKINNSSTDSFNINEYHKLLMSKEFCELLLGNMDKAFLLEKEVFDYYAHYFSTKYSAEYLTLYMSTHINYLSACACARNKNYYYKTLESFYKNFGSLFNQSKPLKVIYQIFTIQKLTHFEDKSISLSDVEETEKTLLEMPQNQTDINTLVACKSALYQCFCIFKQYNKAKKYCEEIMKQKITVGLRKDFVEIANLYYLIILFEETIHTQLHKSRYNFENNYIHIHAKQYYERIRKSSDNYSFDLLFVGFFRKLPKSVTKKELHNLFIKLHSETLILKASNENQYIQNLMLLLNFEDWMLEKIKLFQPAG